MSSVNSTSTSNLAVASDDRPFIATWTDEDGRLMFVGIDEGAGNATLIATDDRSKAAGYPTGSACAASIMANGFKVPNATWVDIGPYNEPRNQMGLF